MNAIGAAVGNRNRDVEHFLDLGLKGARRHDLLDALPSSAKCLRVMRERAPEVVYEIRLPSAANVIEDDMRLGREFIVREQLHCRHDPSRWFQFKSPRF